MKEVTQLTRTWGRALDANLRCTARLSELAGRSLELLLAAVSEVGPQILSTTTAVQEVDRVTSIPPAPAPSPAAMVLEGEAGSRAFGLFVVENKLPKEVSTPVVVGPLVDPDGQEIPSVLRFEPGVITLAPGEQVVARVSAQISRGLAAGVRYQGEISIPGIAGARIPIIVRRVPKTRSAAVAVMGSQANADATKKLPPGRQRSPRKHES
ncbi:MAG: hypothetical protein WBM04_04565 [Candidatus Korobacteraceae bacterium]